MCHISFISISPGNDKSNGDVSTKCYSVTVWG